jgi:alkyl hydroperoxide reductase subunit AhpC
MTAINFLTIKRKLATPVDWKQGENAIILPAVQKAEADSLFPGYQTA